MYLTLYNHLTDTNSCRGTLHTTLYCKTNIKIQQYRQNKGYNEDNLCRHARHVIIFKFVTKTDLLLTVTVADFMSHTVTRCDFCVAIESRIYLPLYSFRSILLFTKFLIVESDFLVISEIVNNNTTISIIHDV